MERAHNSNTLFDLPIFEVVSFCKQGKDARLHDAQLHDAQLHDARLIFPVSYIEKMDVPLR